MNIFLEHDNIPFLELPNTYYAFDYSGVKVFMCISWEFIFGIDVKIVSEAFRNPLWRIYRI